MSPERWQRVNALFHSALERRGQGRSSFLIEACAGDVLLQSEVESLLAAHEDDPSYLSQFPVHDAALRITELNDRFPAGQRVGPYELIRPLGSGGMGTVYLAMRADDAYRKHVAVKFIRGQRFPVDPWYQQELLRRFRTERQTLANLDHPNIARLLDGGTAGDEMPYLVMDYIEGQPIDAYCDAQKLSIADRLKVFRDVCAAVHYAHQNLVIHRDLKPSNILVADPPEPPLNKGGTDAYPPLNKGGTGGVGVPKVIDFGIAKMLDPDSSALAGDLTLTLAKPMTPSYASPEQVRGEPITTASDIYSLGVILYELLTGHRPYWIADLPSHEAARVICEQDPPKPSTAIAQIEDHPARDGAGAVALTPDTVSRTRGGHPDRLRRRLSGDLDTIVLKALRKEPQRRYASAEQFSEDIRRHLEGLPVLARKDTVGYRAAKFVRRHKWGVLAASLTAAALIGGMTTTAWQKKLADTEAQTAEEVAQFLESLFDVPDEYEAESAVDVRAMDITAATLLSRGSQQINELEDQPEIQARLMATLGRLYYKLGDLEQAASLLERALRIQRRELGVTDADTYGTMTLLGLVLNDQGKYVESHVLLEESLAVRERLFGSDDPETIRAKVHLADVLYEQRRLDEARQLLTEALQDCERLDEQDDLLTSKVLEGLGIVLQWQNELPEAENYLRRALELRRGIQGSEHPETLLAMSNLGGLLIDRGKYEEAETLLRELLEIRSRVLSGRHRHLLATKRKLARALWQQHKSEKLKEAEALVREALAPARDMLSDRNPETLYLMNDLALILLDEVKEGDPDQEENKEKLAEAESLFREKLEKGRSLWDEKHEETLITTNNLGDVLMKRGEAEEAEPLLRWAVEQAQKVLTPGHFRTAAFQSNYGKCLTQLGRYEEAEQQLLAAYEARKALFSPGDNRILRVIENLRDLYEDWGKEAELEFYRNLVGSFPNDRP